MDGSKSMTMNSKQLKLQVAQNHCLDFMSKGNFAIDRRAVETHWNTEGVRQAFLELPVFLQLLVERNEQTTSVALQTEDGNDTFLRFFMGFPIALELGKLTMDVLVADCFHYKTPSYEGVCMNIVSRTGFGCTILCAIAIIPIEDSNHICWVLQMCLRHGLESVSYTHLTLPTNLRV